MDLIDYAWKMCVCKEGSKSGHLGMSKQRLIGMLVLKHFAAARSIVHRCYSVRKLR